MKILKGIGKFFCGSDGKFKPPYFWATLLLTLLVVTSVVQLVMTIHSYRQGQAELHLSLVPLAGVLAGLAAGMVAVYNQGKKNKQFPHWRQPHGGEWPPEGPSETNETGEENE